MVLSLKTYEMRYCAFIDMLGFSDAVRTLEAYQLFQALRKFKRHSSVNDDMTIKTTHFSDCVFVSSEDFLDIVFLCLYLTFEMVGLNVVIRGAITHGEIYHDSNYVFGPALINAYELEHKKAKFPRIIFDNGIFRTVKFPSSMSEDEIEIFFTEMIAVDADEYSYLNYFSPNHTGEFDNGYLGQQEFYRRLRCLVNDQLKSAIRIDIKEKYEWVDKKLAAIGR